MSQYCLVTNSQPGPPQDLPQNWGNVSNFNLLPPQELAARGRYPFVPATPPAYTEATQKLVETLAFTGTPSTGSVGTNIGCGFYNRGNVDFINGKIYELIIYENVLSSTDLTSLYNYLKTKWNTP